jgi:hypothetical protein
MNMHDTFTEQTELARTYAQDGALRSAARVLARLADTLVAHADWCDGDVTVAVPEDGAEFAIKRVTRTGEPLRAALDDPQR